MDKKRFFEASLLKREIETTSGNITIRELTLAERESLSEMFKSSASSGLVEMFCLVVDGFDESDAKDVRGLPLRILKQVQEECFKLSGIDSEDDDTEEEAAKEGLDVVPTPG